MTKPTYNAALYLRLSREDETQDDKLQVSKLQGESPSIQTQRKMLVKYAADNHMNVYGEYVDDGWTGTNFERPGFKRMIQDIEDGKINCVIVKDLSRFGRESVITGFYTDFYFPDHNVRFIAVNDNVDSLKGDNEFAPFKNIFNEWYARDTSRKVRAAFQTKFALGEHTCAYAPIGYKKSSDKNKLIIDEESEWIIEKIFDCALSGMGAAKIAKILIKERVPTPAWLNYQRDGKFSHVFVGQPENKRYMWSVQQVKNILHDETYVGNTVHYRQRTISFKNKKRLRKPESEWLRVEDTHEPIISKDDFYRVQDMIKSRRRETKDGEQQIFAGLVKCADCGLSMRFGINRNCAKPYSYFVCSQYARLGKEFCTNHYIRYDTLYEYVLSRIRYWAAIASEDEDKLLTYLENRDNEAFKSSKKRAISDIKKAEKRLKDLDAVFAKLYEDRLQDKINERNFNMLTAKYQKEQDELNELVETLSAKLQEEKEDESNKKNWIALIREYTNPTELTAPLLNALIEKIVVHEAVDTKDGKEQEVEIFYRFIGKID